MEKSFDKVFWRRVMSLCVAFTLLFSTFSVFADTVEGISLACQQIEHSHTDSCYEQTLICGLEETESKRVFTGHFEVHKHGASCYDASGALVCGYIENQYYHTHNDYCKNEAGELVCGLASKKPHEHTDECYVVENELTCGEEETEGHSHGPECYEETSELICQLEETDGHQHDANCYVTDIVLKCELPEEAGHIHTAECYQHEKTLACGLDESEDHQHTEACYQDTDVLVCILEEKPGHAHIEACYENTQRLVCEKVECAAHHHTEECYNITRNLICTQEEKPAHHHTDECYAEKKTLVCDKPTTKHKHTEGCFDSQGHAICGQLEVPTFVCSEESWTVKDGHHHTDACYEITLVCDIPEHVHSEECYTQVSSSEEVNPTDETDEVQTYVSESVQIPLPDGEGDENAEASDVAAPESENTEDSSENDAGEVNEINGSEESNLPAAEDSSIVDSSADDLATPTDLAPLDGGSEDEPVPVIEDPIEDPATPVVTTDDEEEVQEPVVVPEVVVPENEPEQEPDVGGDEGIANPDNETVVDLSGDDQQVVSPVVAADGEENEGSENQNQDLNQDEAENQEGQEEKSEQEGDAESVTLRAWITATFGENTVTLVANAEPELIGVSTWQIWNAEEEKWEKCWYGDNMEVDISSGNVDALYRFVMEDKTVSEEYHLVIEPTEMEEEPSVEDDETEKDPIEVAGEDEEETETESIDDDGQEENPEESSEDVVEEDDAEKKDPDEVTEDGAEEESEEEEEQEEPKEIILVSDKDAPCVVTVKFMSDAGIPEDTVVAVKDSNEIVATKAAAKRGTIVPSLVSAKTKDELPELVVFDEEFDISLVSPEGKEVEPIQGTVVSVQVQFSNLPKSGAIEVWHETKDGDVLLSSRTVGDVVEFETDGFSRFKFRSVAKQLETWSSDNLEFTLWGTLEKTSEADSIDVENDTEGLEVLEAFSFVGDSDLWLSLQRTSELNLDKRQHIDLYTVNDGLISNIVRDNLSLDEVIRFNTAELPVFALVQDSGLRRVEQEFGNIHLTGMMPINAETMVNDVTESYSTEDFADADRIYEEEFTMDPPDVVAVYDIQIMENDEEYQPEEGSPIDIVYYDENITEESLIQVWHIHDDGTKEQVEDVVIENGSVNFVATGFSAYAIVECPPSTPISYYRLDSLDVMQLQNGVYIGHWDNYWLTSAVEENVGGTKGRMGIFKTKPASADPLMKGASVYYFVPVDIDNNLFKIYCYDSYGNIQYVNWHSGSDAVNKSLFFTDAAGATTFEVLSFDGTTEGAYKIHAVGSAYYWNMRGGANGNSFAAFNNSSDVNAKLKFVYQTDVTSDPYNFGNDGYGILSWGGSVTGKAMMSDALNADALDAKVLTVLTEKDHHEDKLFVPDQSDITMWTLHWVGGIEYRISTDVNGETKYLQVTETGVRLVDELESSRLSVYVGSGTHAGQFYMKSNGIPVTYGDTSTGFSVGGNAGSEWLYLVRESELTADYYMTYSARKVSVSDSAVTNGSRIIVYARIWNYETERYEFYAVDHDGTLVRCFEDGDSIQWIGNRINTLLWNFVEYYWEGTSDPNFYYELYNQYSEKFISPKHNNTNVLSSGTVGINLNGRQRGQYYSSILAWDESAQVYAGLKLEDDGDGHIRVVSGSKDEATDFYFAIMQDLPVDDEPTTVPTVDHTQYGITMKMKDFATRSEMSNFLGSDAGGMGTTLHQGLLSTNLVGNYPTTAGGSLGSLFAGAQEVNHLFIQSTYSGTGYYEFDSSQNFASLNGATGGNFTVYKEIGTYDSIGERNTLKHGQFFPYNTIKPGVFAVLNGRNLYDVSGNKLSDSYPRKNEALYMIQPRQGESSVDCYFGVEIEASFVQTPSGYDAWGHDIIYEFTGDDDFWLYVDGELVIDLGGIHSAVPGSVNYHTGKVVVNGVQTTLRDVFYNNYVGRGHSASEAQAYVDDLFMEKTDSNGHTYYTFKDYTTHTMRIFYMERGAGASNLHMRFNLASVKDGHVELSKELNGVDETESMMADFAYQIWYMLPGDDMNAEHQTERLLIPNNEDGISVTYKGSDKEVPYEASFELQGEYDQGTPYTLTYDHVFFLKPGDVVDIDLPDETIAYRIVECGINTDVYSSVTVNDGDEAVTEISDASYPANRKDYGIGYAEARRRARVVYTNTVSPEALRTLSIRKVLLDEQGESEVRNDEETFSFRLYLDSEYNSELNLASMYGYHVRDENGDYCYWNTDTQRFTSLGAGKNSYADLTPEEKRLSTILTSIYGTIGNIPSFYTVEIRELLVGTKFKVEERNDSIPKGYSRQKYVYYADDEDTVGVDSLTPVVDLIETSRDPVVEIYNLKGFGINVEKTWSDTDYVVERAPTYFGLYCVTNGTPELASDVVVYPVLELVQNETNLYWYIEHLRQNATFSQYVVYEVMLEDPQVDSEGHVTGYTSITPIMQDGTLTINGRLIGDTEMTPCEYTVHYSDAIISQNNVNVKEYDISNIRSGILLVKEDMEGTRLPGAEFRLSSEDGTFDATYTSDTNGVITTAFLRENVEYTLEELVSPRIHSGYFGLQDAMKIKVVNGRVVVLEGDARYYSVSSDGKTMVIKNRFYYFRAVKIDSETDRPLAGAHFKLHKEVTVGGYTGYDFTPMAGYEDLVTGSDGVIPGLDNTLPVGNYELREISAPTGYDDLSSNIRFSISPLGIISLGNRHPEDVTMTTTVQADTSVEYLLTIPNHLYSPVVNLTITKTVEGNMADFSKEFTFTLTSVEDEETGASYDYQKDGTVGSLLTGDTFTLKHGDSIIITVPKDKEIIISESSGQYKMSWKKDDGYDIINRDISVVLDEDSEITVTNTLNAVAPTGVDHQSAMGYVAMLLLGITLMLVRKRTKEERK